MKDERLSNLIRRVEKNGFTFTNPSDLTRKISKKSSYIVFKNRRLNKSIIVNEKKLRELLGEDFFF